MAKKAKDFDDRLAALKRAFVDGLAERIEEIDDLAATIGNNIAAGRINDDIAALHVLVHKLAGAAGTFGHPAVGDAAAAVEQRCDDILDGAAAPTADQWRRVRVCLDELRRAAAVTGKKI